MGFHYNVKTSWYCWVDGSASVGMFSSSHRLDMKLFVFPVFRIRKDPGKRSISLSYLNMGWFIFVNHILMTKVPISYDNFCTLLFLPNLTQQNLKNIPLKRTLNFFSHKAYTRLLSKLELEPIRCCSNFSRLGIHMRGKPSCSHSPATLSLWGVPLDV